MFKPTAISTPIRSAVPAAALLFYNIQPSGAFEERSLHQACPVLKGNKWAAVKWIHTTRFPTASERNRGAAAMRADPASWMPEMAKALMPDGAEAWAKQQQQPSEAVEPLTSGYMPVSAAGVPRNFEGGSDAGSVQPGFQKYRKYYQ